MKKVLILNASYEPLSVISAKRAVRLILDDRVEVIKAGEDAISSPSVSIPKPTIIRLLDFVKLPPHKRDYISNRVLFARDKWTCQYCGRYYRELKQGERLTRDHVEPTSKGGKDIWENVITACNTCNSKKGEHLPYEIHMYPLKTPTKPAYLATALLSYCTDDEQREYIEEWCGGRD